MNDLRRQYDAHLLPVYTPPSPVFTRGQGAKVWDTEGREYVDFGGGIAVLSLGHAPPSLSAAIAEQAGRLLHTSNLHVNDVAAQLAARLTQETFASRVYLCNSGAEANEAAIKLARHRGVAKDAEKYRMVAFDGGFHGRVGMAMAASGQAKVREGFGPLTPGFCFAPYNDLAAAAALMNDEVCAILLEPVQGENGVRPASLDFLRGLRDLADQYDALLIFDEIQSGAGRCGTLYYYQQTGVTPDVMTTAKGLGGGFPVAAMLTTEEAAAHLPVGTHGSTYGGNPLASRAALAVLDEILSPGFLDGVRRRGELFINKLMALDAEFNCFTDIRGKGCWLGCDLRGDMTAKALAAAALAEGLIVITAGEKTLRLAPALNIPDEDTAEGFTRLWRAMEKLSA